MGSPLSTFTQFLHSTPAIYLTDSSSVIVEAQKQTYVLSRFINGDPRENIQGGQKIKDVIIFNDASTFQHYRPNDTFTYQAPQVTTQMENSWRFSLDHYSFTDHEIELNFSEGMTIPAQRAEYKRLKEIIKARVMTSMLNGFENALWAAPANQQAEMEATSGSTPYSIPVFVNETVTTGLPTGWTTIQNINPSTEALWTCQRQLYDYADPGDADGGLNGLLDAFEHMQMLLTWKPPKVSSAGGADRYFEKPGDRRTRFICCSVNGMKLFKAMCRERNDRLLSVQDPAIPNVSWDGIDIEYIKTLDTAALYAASGSTFNTELNSATTTRGPRFYWLDARYLKFYVHTRNVMKLKELVKHPNQPFTNVALYDTWWNLFCRSRQRLGIVAPGG